MELCLGNLGSEKRNLGRPRRTKYLKEFSRPTETAVSPKERDGRWIPVGNEP